MTSTSADITAINGSNLSTPIKSYNYGTLVSMTSNSSGDAYKLLPNTGFTSAPPTNESNNWTNWSKYESSINGINASSFGLFEFQIPVTLTGGGTDTFQFQNLPEGTFIIAYGTTSTHVYDTPFTQAGLETGSVTAVPAPHGLTLALSGCGVFGLFALVRRRKIIARAA